MELEVGIYVRTKDGKIDKIFQYNENPDNPLFETINCYSVMKGKYKKASHNIIDLIEVGDYVNGNEVMEADWINENGEYEEGLAFPMYASDDLDVIENWLPLRCVDIKSIVTKEQFESMEYRLGE